MSGANDDRLSIARSIWRDAQEREKIYWVKRCSDPIGVMYEMGEDLDLAWRLKECIPTEPKSFLDIGVGPMGTGLLWLFPKCSLKIGLDSLGLMEVATGNRHADELARLIRAESRYVIGKSEMLPFTDETFDVVVCNNVLDHVEQVEQSVAELCRVVRTGGFLALGLDTNSHLGYWLRKVDRMMRPTLNTYRLHPTDIIIGHTERHLRDHHFRILSSNEASRLGQMIGRRRTQSWVAVKEVQGQSGSAAR